MRPYYKIIRVIRIRLSLIMKRTLANTFGIVFLIVGLLGFVSNPLVGENGFFYTDATHNVVHILFGLVLLAVGIWAVEQAGSVMLVSGIIYILLAIIGLFTSNVLGFLQVNTPDNWLHVLLGIGLIWAGASGEDMVMENR